MGKKTPKHLALLQDLTKYLRGLKYEVVEEVVFNTIMPTSRLYRADYCILEEKIMIEVNGGQYSGGRHTRAGKVKGKPYTQYENDLNKLNLAQKNGWKVFQFTYEQLKRQEYKDFI
jgi:very-short-patch-repair endonuclease